jgi:hypothetical protein
MKVDNNSIERVEEFKYLGMTLTNQNSIQKEIKSRLKLRNACTSDSLPSTDFTPAAMVGSR